MFSGTNNLDFICEHCGKEVFHNDLLGNHQRNHCPFCLWSKHEDLNEAGDRKSNCHGQMEPIGLTFKKEGQDKYGKEKQGELMLIHQCVKCFKISINHLAADDDSQIILEVFEKSKKMDLKQREELKTQGIEVLDEKDKKEVENQLFGKSI